MSQIRVGSPTPLYEETKQAEAIVGAIRASEQASLTKTQLLAINQRIAG